MPSRPLRRPHFPDALYEENWRSARRGVVGFDGCVWVSLLPGRLVTGAHFPFNFMAPRALYRWVGADVDIPFRDIVSVENERLFLQQGLRITYRTPSGEASFWLRLRRPDALREALIVARQRA